MFYAREKWLWYDPWQNPSWIINSLVPARVRSRVILVDKTRETNPCQFMIEVYCEFLWQFLIPPYPLLPLINNVNDTIMILVFLSV